MKKSLVSISAIFFLLFSMLVLPREASARCEAEMPATLLSLYTNSKSVYVARYDKTVEGDVVREDEDYSVVAIKKYFDVSSALKGESRKIFVLEEEEYRFKNAAEKPADQEEAAEPEHFEAEDNRTELTSGDRVLLFVTKDAETGKDILAHYADGIRKVADAQLASYEARIKELSTIMAAEKVSDAEIVAWLVRCVEDPATRWDGSFELLNAFEQLDWQAASAKERAEAIERGETVDEPEPHEGGGPDTSAYAKVLDLNQKRALTNVLLSRPPAFDVEGNMMPPQLIKGDRELIDLVKRWGDPRMASFLVEQLRNNQASPYESSQMMDAAAGLLKDAQASSIAAKFGEIYYMDDNEVVKDEPEAKIGKDSMTSEIVIVRDKAAAKAKQAAPLTYKQLRDDLYAKFIKRADRVLAKQYEPAGK